MRTVQGNVLQSLLNVQSFLELVTDDGELKLDFDDEVVKGACVVRGGKVEV